MMLQRLFVFGVCILVATVNLAAAIAYVRDGENFKPAWCIVVGVTFLFGALRELGREVSR